MFQAAKDAPTAERRYDAIAGEIQARVAQGTFYITEVLQEPHPFQSDALMFLEGSKREGSFIRPHGAPISMPPVRLVCISNQADPANGVTGDIRYKETVRERKIGTADQYQAVQKWRIAGTDVSLPFQVALQVLHRHGFPHKCKGSVRGKGNVVEWAWLENEAKRADCLPEVKQIYDELTARLANEAKQNKKQTAAPAQASL